MLDTLNKENIIQKRIEVYNPLKYKKIKQLNPFYPFRIFARSRYDGYYLDDNYIDIICRFMSHYLSIPTLSVNECAFRMNEHLDNIKTLYDLFDKQHIDISNIDYKDRIIMLAYCLNDYDLDTTRGVIFRVFGKIITKDNVTNDVIDEDIMRTLNKFGVDKLIWHDDYGKFMYDNYIVYYHSYDKIRKQDIKLIEEMGSDMLYELGDPNRFPFKNTIFNAVQERQGTNFIIKHYYEVYERVARLTAQDKNFKSTRRYPDDVKVEDVQWLVDNKWPLELIQREMGFDNRYALKRYLNKHNIDYEACKKRPGRPRGSFKNTSARNQIYEDFAIGLVPDTIYEKYKGVYSKRSIDRIYREWENDQAGFKS